MSFFFRIIITFFTYNDQAHAVASVEDVRTVYAVLIADVRNTDCTCDPQDEMCAGFGSYKGVGIIGDCESCYGAFALGKGAQSLPQRASDSAQEPDAPPFSYIETVDRGGLTVPSAAICQSFAKCKALVECIVADAFKSEWSRAFFYSTNQRMVLRKLCMLVLTPEESNANHAKAFESLYTNCPSPDCEFKECSREPILKEVVWRFVNILLNNYTKVVKNRVDELRHAKSKEKADDGKEKDPFARKLQTFECVADTVAT